MQCNKKCCTVKCCPLVPAWATTIHKFQGFEAGFDDKDQFNRLICDPGDLKWEQTCPGALYTAISRAKTMGTFSKKHKHPKDSAIYWEGPNISTTRILEGSLKNAKRKGDPKVDCLLINKREAWVSFLQEKADNTKRMTYDSSTRQCLKNIHFSQQEVLNGIADIITCPNKKWLRQKRKHHTLQKTFFGLYI